MNKLYIAVSTAFILLATGCASAPQIADSNGEKTADIQLDEVSKPRKRKIAQGFLHGLERTSLSNRQKEIAGRHLTVEKDGEWKIDDSTSLTIVGINGQYDRPCRDISLRSTINDWTTHLTACHAGGGNWVVQNK